MSIMKTESQNAATTPTRCMHSHCMPQAHLNDLELTGDMCALVLVGVANAFGIVAMCNKV